jgi:hypothetical protein
MMHIYKISDIERAINHWRERQTWGDDTEVMEWTPPPRAAGDVPQWKRDQPH